MAIVLNDNIKINAGKPSESKYLNSLNVAYTSLSAATTAIPISERHLGLTVLIQSGATNIEYWWKSGVQNANLIEKKFSSEQYVGDFITGATNLGYFSGQTGIQTLSLSGFPSTPTDFDTIYYSEYNWYYADADDIIRFGSPTYNGPLRRAYVDITRTKSWIYSVSYSGWILSYNDVAANVGSAIIPYTYSGSLYTGETWSGFNTNGSTSIEAVGSLTTGNTLTIGNPIYNDKSNQELHLRTIVNDTPEYIKIETDDNFIHFSGATAVITGTNYGTGTGVYSGKTGSNLKFRTLVGSGDTSISTKSNGDLVIYSSSEGSATAFTGVTNVGGGVGVYSGTTDKNVQLRTFIGSGNTTVSQVGNNIIVRSIPGGDEVFTEDIVVNISSGKSFGKYEDGDTIPASGKTAAEVIILACFEAIAPTVSLSSSGNNVAFGETTKVVNLNFSYVINTYGATISSVLLEWRRNDTGAWSALTTNTGATTYVHNIDDSGNRFNTNVLNYRYTAIDSEGMSSQTTHNVTPQTYQAPTTSLTLNGTVTSPETQTYREKGNVDSSPYGSITSNRSLVDITDWTLERRYNSGSWSIIASGSSLSTQSVTIVITPDTTIPTAVNNIEYRITYTDEYTTGSSSIQTITFGYFNYAGVSTNTSLSSSQIIGLGNVAFATSTSKTNNYTTTLTEYAYYAYPSLYDDLTDITMLDNGVGSPIPIFGAFQKLSNVSVTNSYGELLTYKVYRSNAPGAFSTDVVTFS